MVADKTQHQSQAGLNKARELSLEPTRPPANIPGYVLESFLGSGGYGEVWKATDQKTGRSVAIKFYTQRSASDVQQLAQEVGKLVVLSADRYVVQLLDVGWNAQPPYYVMDYIDQGSLEERLDRQGVYAPEDAVELFREIAQGMMHLHGKGILHCDLKPANVLLDEDDKPRLADFGQSRLSNDRSGALGTLYYMAPEQADLDAVPDARWDVYALGAILYRMLTGAAPFSDQALTEEIQSSAQIGDRLAAYRTALRTAEAPSAHWSVVGVDRALADIINRCIALDPNDRFASVQSVLLALRQREIRQERRPLLMLGIFGPLLLMAVTTLFGHWAFNRAASDTTAAVIAKAKESNDFKARLAARSAAEQILEYFRVVEHLSREELFLRAFNTFDNNQELKAARKVISLPNKNSPWKNGQREENDPVVAKARKLLLDHPDRKRLDKFLASRLLNPDQEYPFANSWFINDREGNQVSSIFQGGENHTQLNNYAFRTYFTGLDVDQDEGLIDSTNPRQIIDKPHLSAIFLSQATNTWKVAFSAPIIVNGATRGIVAVTVELGDFIDFSNGRDQYVMLVDNRDGENSGVILEHPLLEELRGQGKPIPTRISQKKIQMPIAHNSFSDPFSTEPEGAGYRRRALVSSAPVSIERKPVSTQSQTGVIEGPIAIGEQVIVSIDTGLDVLAVEDYQSVMDPVILLENRLLTLLLVALLILACVAFGMWWLVNRTLSNGAQSVIKMFGPSQNQSWLSDQETLPAKNR